LVCGSGAEGRGELSRFFGIRITLYYDDHGPPHFHVRYGDQRAVIAGELSPRVRGLVVEWAALHRAELREAWNLAMQHAALKPIAPLSETMLDDIVEAKPLGGYRLYLRYADGAAGEIDLAPLLQFTGVFEPLRDPEFFAQVRVNPDIGTIVWPNGVDPCPDVLRHHLTGEPLPGRTDSSRRAG
jgi:uncharacterized protein DUF2442/uncharacterized protein DUF4160